MFVHSFTLKDLNDGHLQKLDDLDEELGRKIRAFLFDNKEAIVDYSDDIRSENGRVVASNKTKKRKKPFVDSSSSVSEITPMKGQTP